jgi:hypothetical protein
MYVQNSLIIYDILLWEGGEHIMLETLDSNWTSGYSQVYQKGRTYLNTCRPAWRYLGLLLELVLSILMKIHAKYRMSNKG